MNGQHLGARVGEGRGGGASRPWRLVAPMWWAVILWLEAHAWAGGIQLVERGTRALALGGASVAAPDDLNAAYLNPAALTRQRGWFAQVEAALVDYRVDFLRDRASSSDPGCCTVASSDVYYLNPTVGLGYAPPGGWWVVALSAFGPYAGATEYPPDSDARYMSVDQDNGLAYAQLSVAARLGPGVSVGLGLQLREFWMHQQVVASVYPGFIGAPEDRDFDSMLTVDVKDWFHPGAVIGLSWTPVEGLWVGASYQTPMEARADGTLQVQVPANYIYASLVQRGEEIRITTWLPDTWRAGVRYEGWARLALEASVVLERWSLHDSMVIEPQEDIVFDGVPGIGRFQVPTMVLDESFVDTWSWRFGGEVRPRGAGGPVIRLGVFKENSAVPDETVTAGSVDWDKVGLALGLGVGSGDLTLDLGYCHLFLDDRVVADNRRTAINPTYPGAGGTEYLPAQGNGSYQGAADVLSVALGVRL